MRVKHVYALVKSSSLKVGDFVRYIPGANNQVGWVMSPRSDHERNAILKEISGDRAYVELIPSAKGVSFGTGRSHGISISVPIRAGGSLKIT